jgi:hypothetical protein
MRGNLHLFIKTVNLGLKQGSIEVGGKFAHQPDSEDSTCKEWGAAYIKG